MKKYLYIITICLFIITVTACSDKTDGNKLLNKTTALNNNIPSINMSDSEKTSLLEFDLVFGMPPGIKVETYINSTFPIDTNYLLSIGTPDYVLEDVKGQNAGNSITVDSPEYIYYFIDKSIMNNYNGNLKIYAVEKYNYQKQCVFDIGEHTDLKATEILSAVYYDGCLYWSGYYLTSDEWFIVEFDTNSKTAEILLNYTDLPSGIVPILSCDSDGLYWYTGKEENGIITYGIMNYSKDTGLKSLFSNIHCPNPFTRFTADNNSYCYIAGGNFNYSNDNSSFSLSLDDYNHTDFYASSDNFIIWEELPEANNYTSIEINIYDIAQNKIIHVNDKELNGMINGCGIIGKYPYINLISNDYGSTDYRGICLIDTDSKKIYSISDELGENEFNRGQKLENGSVFFKGKDNSFNISFQSR